MILVLVRFALGAGEATMYPATSQFVERWFPMRERGKTNGISFGGVGVGSGLTPPLVTAIIVHQRWSASFWFSAVVGVSLQNRMVSHGQRYTRGAPLGSRLRA